MTELPTYFDIDASAINCPVQLYKEFLLQNYSEYISMLGNSIGGAGVFFLCKVNGLKEANFATAHEYFRTEIFQQLPIDKDATGISRSFFIPSDKNLYINKNIETDIKNINFNKDEKCIGQCIYSTPSNVLPWTIHFAHDKNVRFLSMNEVLQTLKFQTPVDMQGQNIIIKPVQFIRLFIPNFIPDGKKHSTFRNITNILVHLNPDAELLPILSYLNWVNQSRTFEKQKGAKEIIDDVAKPMEMKEMIRTVTAAYEYSKLSGLWNTEWLKEKHIHFAPNPGKSKAERKAIADERRITANRINGRRAKDKSLLAIEIVVDGLKMQGIKPTISQVSEILKGRLSICTVKKYWRSVVPKNTDLQGKEYKNEHDCTFRAIKGKDEAPKNVHRLTRREYYVMHKNFWNGNTIEKEFRDYVMANSSE